MVERGRRALEDFPSGSACRMAGLMARGYGKNAPLTNRTMIASVIVA